MARAFWKSIAWPSIGLMIVFSLRICVCLKDLRMNVPQAVARGDAVTLSCYYNLENASLYSVRWYLEQEEFYRFVPKESPPSRVFGVNGIAVDLTKSGEHTVTLKSVTRIISGVYQCEVSADAPLFHTETSKTEMLVAELPAHNPTLFVYNVANNSENGLAIGELLKATCVSSPSFPPVNFTWIINGNIYPSSNFGLRTIQADEKNTPAPTVDLDNEAWSELIMRVDHMLIAENRKMLIRCETNIFNLYRGASETEIQINDDSVWIQEGKVSPTIDQRSSSSSSSSSTSLKSGDPDNSALQAGAIRLFDFRLKIQYFLSQLVCVLVIRASTLS